MLTTFFTALTYDQTWGLEMLAILVVLFWCRKAYCR